MADAVVTVNLEFNDDFFVKIRNAVRDGIRQAQSEAPEPQADLDSGITKDDVRAQVTLMMQGANKAGRGDEMKRTVRAIFNDFGGNASTLNDIPDNKLGLVMQHLVDYKDPGNG